MLYFLVAPEPPKVNNLMPSIQYFVNEFLPSFVNLMTGLELVPGVSLFGFLIAVSLLCLVIGGILLR